MESFEAERTHPGIPAVVRPWREIGMGRLRRPRPVRPNLSLQEIPRGLRARVIAVAEADDRLEADEDVVIIVVWRMQPLPRWVSAATFTEESALEVELGPSFDGAFPFSGPPPATDCGVRRECLPTIEGSVRTAEAVPTAVVELPVCEPVERGARSLDEVGMAGGRLDRVREPGVAIGTRHGLGGTAGET